MVKFERRNLMEQWPFQQAFDVVFLRNVMIYFDTPSRKAILSKVAGNLVPGGYLLMGGGESPMSLSGRFEMVTIGRTAIYRRKAS